MDKIKVLVVDDSLPVRKAFDLLLRKSPDIDHIGSAEDPIEAIGMLKQCWPDVIVLDIEMPKIDGLTFLDKIMRERPTPVIICSTLTGSANSVTERAFSLGAAAVMGKPAFNNHDGFVGAADDIVQTIRSLAKVRAEKLVNTPSQAAVQPVPTQLPGTTLTKFIAIGSSTGGPQALESVMPHLPANLPPIGIVQHMPGGFTGMLAKRLDSLSQISVYEAENGMILKPGMAVIAPGGLHFQVKYDAAGNLVADVRDGPLVNRHKPSVDMFFRSVRENLMAKRCIAAILTGMGNDGAAEMLNLRNAGATTIAQDEATSVVWGMPGEAVKLNAASHVLPLNWVARKLVELTFPPAD